MARFTDLNQDVLRLIISHLSIDHYHGRRTQHALTLTCRATSKIATQSLYSTIRACILTHGQQELKLQLLLRTINQPEQTRAQQLISYIRDLSLSWVFEKHVMEDPTTRDFMNSLENLRSLYLSVLRSGPRTCDISFWDISKLRLLQKVDLNYENTSTDLARFLCLTPAHTIRIHNIDQWKPDPFTADGLPVRRRPLRKLELRTHYPVSDLHAILSATAGVQHLDLMEPGVREQHQDLICPGCYMDVMETPFPPSSIQHALDPVRDALETLNLTSVGSTTRWPNGHDGSALDLSAFPRLRCADLDSKCFFPIFAADGVEEGDENAVAARNCRQRKGDITGLLPPSLESLQVYFDAHASAVKLNRAEGDGQWLTEMVDASDETGVDDYQWILDVVLGTREGGPLPNLRRFAVEESDFEGPAFCDCCDPFFNFCPWEAPPGVRAVLNAAKEQVRGLEVEITVRVRYPPQPYDELSLPREGTPSSASTGNAPMEQVLRFDNLTEANTPENETSVDAIPVRETFTEDMLTEENRSK